MISWMSFFRPSARDAAAALITSRQNLDKMALVSASEILLDKIALVRFCQRDNSRLCWLYLFFFGVLIPQQTQTLSLESSCVHV